MAKETQPAQVGDQIQILELHPGDYYPQMDPDKTKQIYKNILTVTDTQYLLCVGIPGNKEPASLLTLDGYPYYTIHKRAKDATKN